MHRIEGSRQSVWDRLGAGRVQRRPLRSRCLGEWPSTDRTDRLTWVSFTTTTLTSSSRRDAAPSADGRPWGLMGRQVAGRAFLAALLRHGTWTDLAILSRHPGAEQNLERACRENPSERLRRIHLFDEMRLARRPRSDPSGALAPFTSAARLAPCVGTAVDGCRGILSFGRDAHALRAPSRSGSFATWSRARSSRTTHSSARPRRWSGWFDR